VRFWATPLTSGPSLWRYETEDTTRPQYPTNTNDGALVDFHPLQQILFMAKAALAPPTAVVTITLSFATNTKLLGPLMLLAPESFRILPSSCGRNCTCTPSGTYPGTLRQAANLTNTAGGAPLLDASFKLEVTVQLPQITPRDRFWLLRGFSREVRDISGKVVKDGAIIAWGAFEGFPLQPMNGVSVFYNALIGSRNTRVVVTFESRVPGGEEIFLRAPLHYGLFCRTPDALKQLALPGDRPVCYDNYGSKDPKKLRELSLAINGTVLGIGEYAFGVICDLPVNATAAAAVAGFDATWSLLVRGNNGSVLESIFAIPPLPIANVGLSTPILSWSQSEANRRSTITVGFTVEKAITGVRALLLVFPSRVLHDVRVAGDFEVSGPNFPYVSGMKGLLLTEMSMLRLLLTKGSSIPEGLFRFRFPVSLPWDMPSQNLWHLALCSTASCLKPDDPDVKISFVLAGFNIGERSPTPYGQAASGVPHQARYGWILLMSASLLWQLSSWSEM